MTQNTATLTEWHDLVRKTRFNIFQSQGDQRRLMQETTRKVLNRRIDALQREMHAIKQSQVGESGNNP